MKIFIFSTKNHIYGNKIIKELLMDPDIKTLGIVESKVLYPGRSDFKALMRYIKTSGHYYVIGQIIKVIFFRIGKVIYGIYPKKDLSNMLFPYQNIAKKKGVPIINEKNINDKEFIKKIKRKNPDIFVSVLFNQIFKEEILSVPKITTINIHPAMLPSYRGVSPTFWAIANSEKKTGVTIHEINNRKIDQGKILAQSEILITKHDTETTLYWRCINAGIPLLKNVIKSGSNRKRGLKNNLKPSYYSLPTKDAVSKFRKKNRSFFNFKELFQEK